ncbi:MAG TPA: FAD-dependent oxidoreductase [Cyclobacteriaceae bacterium]|nr:FAD-dependent oxidoreductase [Cyclobacteriaceae bacterium]
MINRRNFIRQAVGSTLGVIGATTLFTRCDTPSKITTQLSGPDFKLGHRLRAMDFGNIISKEKKDVVIVGGGVSGLSAARQLKKSNIDFALLELESKPGGNSSSGKNTISSYPLGAHYLPIPNDTYNALNEFLKEANVITGYENGLPVFNEYYLCFAPKERLFIHDHWQEGLQPISGVPEKDRIELSKFNELMEIYKHARGADGKEAFCIPVDYSSTDPTFTSLDNLSMEAFLTEKGFSSSYLLWYVNYCCADDFGATTKGISAWAGIHYFSSRKGKGINTTSDTVLTWPEGNSFLVNLLKKDLSNNIITNALTYNVAIADSGVLVSYFDAAQNECKQIIADQVIIATPQFGSTHILPEINRNFNARHFEYAPWIVANISTHSLDLDNKRGETLSWDNVIYGCDGLGYINSTHQNINQYQPDKILTYYKPLTGEPKAERQRLYQEKADYWLIEILKDLRKPHPEIDKSIKAVDIWRWGHGMIRPSVGFMWGESRYNASQSIRNRIHFAHSDLSGISIFEEAFYRGVEASKKIINA